LLYGATMEHLITVHASMGNHVHLLLTSSDRDALTGVMRRVGGPPTARWPNAA
jgi:REP element-mobilizing transposase RayT